MITSPNKHIAIKTLDWKLSTTEVFEHFANLPWAMLLDSGTAEHPDARYDIICHSPVATLVTKGLITKICHIKADGQKSYQKSNSDPFALLKETIDKYFPSTYQSTLPFSAGAMGAFSYDLARRFETLPQQALADIELPEMNIGIYQWALVFDNRLKTWFISHYLGDKALIAVVKTLEEQLAHPVNSESFSLKNPWQAQTSKQEYQHKFNVIQKHLHQGDCYQINLTQRFNAGYQGDEWQAYLKLRGTNKAPFSAFIRLKNHVLLSQSPERFLQLRGNDIQAKPIKGTMVRSTDSTLDKQAYNALANSEKDRAENVMIVDLLRNDIGKVAKSGTVKVPQLFAVESFPAVHHLVSTVTAKLMKQYHAGDLLRAAFPGGSITGAPKIRAMEIIEQLEPSRRSLYCGAIGYISQDGQMDTSITIRTIVAENKQLYCWAGGGIVADSQVDAEYQESYDKVSKILPILTE